MPRSAVRVGKVVIFPNGGVVKISEWQRLMFKLRVKKTIKNPYTHYEIFK